MGNLKNMASMAKERLRRGLYTNAEKNKAKSAMNLNSYFLKNLNALKKINSQVEFVTISNEIDENFTSKVYSILTSNKDIYNPIGMLIDKDIFNSLNDVEKQFYVLKVVDNYNKIKDNYTQSKNAKIG